MSPTSFQTAPPRVIAMEQKSTVIGVTSGWRWIRTTEANMQQIYSLSPLATREHSQNRSLKERLFSIAEGAGKSKSFFEIFPKKMTGPARVSWRMPGKAL